MKLKHFLYTILIAINAISCSKNDDKIEIPVNRTILVYMAADNNLNSFGADNIEKMLEGAGYNNLNGGNLIVYVDPSNDKPQLLQIKTDKDGIAYKETVISYETEHNSASTENMRSVIDDVIKRYPSDSYGLILWSHGTGWMPSNISNMLRAFGQDGANWMELNDLAQALPDKVFDFILFDACSMASIEVSYALRKKADYIIASSTEVLASGFPYHKIIAPLFKENADLKAVCSEFYNYYNNQSGYMRSATVSLTETAHLENLATITRDILYGKESDIYSLSLYDIQIFDYLPASSNPKQYHLLYDIEDFISRLASTNQYASFQNSLSNVITYKQTTPNAFFEYGGQGITIPVNTYSGLSIYIPQQSLAKVNEWYKQLDWYKAIYE